MAGRFFRLYDTMTSGNAIIGSIAIGGITGTVIGFKNEKLKIDDRIGYCMTGASVAPLALFVSPIIIPVALCYGIGYGISKII